MVPLSIYFKDGKAKVELALARGRHHYDKRRAIASPRRRAGGRPGGPSGHSRAAGPLTRAGTPFEPRRQAVVGMLGSPTTGQQGSMCNHGGDRLRLWSSIWEKRAVVSGATLKSRKQKQMPSLSSQSLPKAQ